MIICCIYVAKKIIQCFSFKSAKLLSGLLIFGFLSLIFANIIYRGFSFPFASFYFMIANWWMGAFLILLMTVLIFQIIDLVYDVFHKTGGIVLIALWLLVSLYATWQAFTYSVVPITVKLNKVKEIVKIVHLSDIHLGVYRGNGYLTHLVKNVNRLNADVVIINGDLVDGKNDVRAEKFLAFKDFTVPVYFVAGNHDYYAGLKKLVTQIKKGNVKFLFNESIIIKGVQITGLDFMQGDKKSRRMHFVNTRTIQEIMPTIKLNKRLPQILFHHSPTGVKYIEKAGVDLMVSGHTHGGQIFPVTIFGSFIYRVNKGLGAYKKMKIYVSQGVGTFGPPMRLGTHGEITLITVTGK